MGWLDDRAGSEEVAASGRRTHVAPGLWAMNDAGWSHPLAAPQQNLISWFQVEVSALADDRPLPVQPFLRCAQDTTERIGAAQLPAVQVLLPVRAIDASARPPHRPCGRSTLAGGDTVRRVGGVVLWRCRPARCDGGRLPFTSVSVHQCYPLSCGADRPAGRAARTITVKTVGTGQRQSTARCQHTQAVSTDRLPPSGSSATPAGRAAAPLGNAPVHRRGPSQIGRAHV